MKFEYWQSEPARITLVIRVRSSQLCVPSNAYNSPESKVKIAAVIGRLLIKMGYKTNSALWEQFSNEKIYDIEKETVLDAILMNRFAWAFLTPKDEFEKQVKEHTMDGRALISVIADYFQVPYSTIKNRGIILGMWESRY